MGGRAGSDSDGTIDADALSEWVKNVRELAIAAKRVDIIDQQVGVILWRHRPSRMATGRRKRFARFSNARAANSLKAAFRWERAIGGE